MKAIFKYLRTLTVLSLLLSAALSAEAAVPSLKVTLENGSASVYPLGAGTTIQFVDGELVISDAGHDVKIPIDHLLKWEYVNPAGVSDVSTSAVTIFFEGTVLHVSGLAAGRSIEVYAADGTQVFSATSTGSEIGIPTDSWTAGVYMVKHSGTITKVVKR